MKDIDLIRIQFFVTKEEYFRFENHAKRNGLSISNFCKMAAFVKIRNYPLKKE